MGPTSTVHIVRHAQGFHQLPRNHPNVYIRDPSLTTQGVIQSKDFSLTYPFHAQTDLLCASPLRRTIQTASLAFNEEIQRGLRILLVPDAQESSSAPSDTGSDTSKLIAEFNDVMDISLLYENWYKKTGANGPNDGALRERARRLRNFLRNRPENVIVLVSPGQFAHYITEHVDTEGHQTGKRATTHRPQTT